MFAKNILWNRMEFLILIARYMLSATQSPEKTQSDGKDAEVVDAKVHYIEDSNPISDGRRVWRKKFPL